MSSFKIAGVVAVLFISGILFAFFLPKKEVAPASQNTQVSSTAHLFSDFRLGTPVRPEFATQSNPPIKQKAEYTIQEQIMLQGTTTSSATGPVEVTVRLVDEKSTITELSPSRVTLQKGTSAFCCWVIPTPGDYTVQIFRPDSVITRLPIKIVRDFGSTATDK